MVYCDDGSMRAFLFKKGHYHVLNGWKIVWNSRNQQYEITKRGRAKLWTTVKAEAYKMARQDLHRRPGKS
jgi:hypothetical protein